MGRGEQQKLSSFSQPFIQQRSRVFSLLGIEMKVIGPVLKEIRLGGGTYFFFFFLDDCNAMQSTYYQGRCRQGGNAVPHPSHTGRLLGGRETRAKVGALLKPGRHILVRLLLYSQGLRVTLFLLWEQIEKARPQNKGQLMAPMERVK